MSLEKVDVPHDEPRLPTAHESALARESSRVLSLHVSSTADERYLCVIDDNGEQEKVTIPSSAFRLLLDILSQMSLGNAVNVTPVQAVLTTQEAADMLNVSRPFLVKLLENGKIPFHKTGAHRRIYYKDIIDYKSHIDSQRTQSLDELAAQAQELDIGY